MKSSPTTNSGDFGTVGIDRHLVGILLDLVGRGAALDAAEIEIGLVIDAPELVGDQLAVEVGIERRVGIDMDHRRHAPVIGLVHVGIDAERAFLAGTSISTSARRRAPCRRALDGDRLRQLEHVPDLVDPGADADHHRARRRSRPLLVSSAVTAPAVRAELEACHLDAGEDAHALGLGLGGEAVHAGLVVGVAAALLVQHRGDALRLPVVEQALHVAHRVVGALDEHRLVADRLLLLVDRGDVARACIRG